MTSSNGQCRPRKSEEAEEVPVLDAFREYSCHNTVNVHLSLQNSVWRADATCVDRRWLPFRPFSFIFRHHQSSYLYNRSISHICVRAVPAMKASGITLSKSAYTDTTNWLSAQGGQQDTVCSMNGFLMQKQKAAVSEQTHGGLFLRIVSLSLPNNIQNAAPTV